MASRREFEMLFQLSAQMNSNFAGTFGKAQQQLLSMQQEIQELNKAQSDISAYQKQQQAVESTQKKLEMLQQQYDNIQKEIQETGGFSADLENKLLSKQQQIDRTSSSLEKQTQKLDQMGTSLRDAGVDTRNLEKESERLSSEMAELKKKQDEAAESAESFGEKSNQAITTVANAFAAAGIAATLHEIYEAYMECVSVAGNFEESMSNVEALSGANNAELQQLKDLAKELGATTKFTAKESADAMGYMAMAGWDAQQMLAGMPGVLQLAAASGEDLAMVSDIVTDSMTAFGLSAADTSRYADILAATAANANTSVGVMGETFKYAAPVAGALGYSVEDVATAIGLMANSGIKGSNAGTTLRNIFNGLLDSVTLTSDAFGEYELSAVKADGTMADFATTLDELRYYFSQMTEAEQVQNATVIAGQRGYSGLLAILNATEEDYAKLTESINNSSGAAQRMADIKMDNMNGQLTLLNSAWEAIQTTVGEQFTPTLADLYGWGAKTLSGINSFLQKHPALIKSVTAFVGVLGAVSAGVAGYSAVTKVAIPLMQTFTASIPGVNLIMGATVAVAALTAGIVALTASSDDSVPSVKELTEAARQMEETMAAASASYGEVTNSTEATANVAEMYIAKLEALGEGTDAADDHSQEYLNTLALLTNAVPELSEYINLQTGAIEGGTAALREHTDAWKADAEQQAYQEYINSLLGDYNAVVQEAAENDLKLTAAETKLTNAEQRRNEIVDEMDRLWNEMTETAQRAAEQGENTTEATEELLARYNDLGDELIEVDKEYRESQKAVNNLTDAIEEDNKAVEEAESILKDAQEAYDALTEEERKQAEAQAEIARQTQEVNDSIAITMEKVESLAVAYNDAYEAAYSSVSGQYDLWDKAAEVAEIQTSTINESLAGQATYWQDYNANLQALSARAGEIEGLSDVIASFADGSEESVNAIAGMATASDEDLAAMVENWKLVQEEQKAVSESIAELKTDFTNQMDELQSELAADIEAMNLSDEAAASGRATIQGYIDAAQEQLPRVQAAYANLGAAAAAAMRNASGGSTSGSGKGYAIGTSYAEPGYAVVGENGPEIVLMEGGEKVLNAAETRALQKEYTQTVMLLPELFKQMRGYAIGTGSASPGLARVGESGPEAIFDPQAALFAMPSISAEEAIYDAPAHGENNGKYVVTYAPVYNLNGNMSAAEVESVLREHDANMRDQLEEMLAEIEADRVRSDYR